MAIDDLKERLRELDVRGYQPLTGAIGNEAATRIEELERDLAAKTAECDALKHDIERALETSTELATENERLREDAERYLHVRNSEAKTGNLVVHRRVYDGYHHAITGAELDAAIDAERKRHDLR